MVDDDVAGQNPDTADVVGTRLCFEHRHGGLPLLQEALRGVIEVSYPKLHNRYLSSGEWNVPRQASRVNQKKWRFEVVGMLGRQCRIAR
jgi:hypothetical protein